MNLNEEADEELGALLRDCLAAADFTALCDNEPDEALATGARRDSDNWNASSMQALHTWLINHREEIK